MLSLLKHLAKRWSDWVGDHETEVAIRRHLSDNGYFGKTAKIQNYRLVAVQRPGWVQVYQFDVRARVRPENASEDDVGPDTAVYEERFGLVKADTRGSKLRIRTFDDRQPREELLDEWAEDLLRLRRRR
ncbi:MAG: hypothetical protein AAF958_14945 [Planctomycetota bacterium]